MISEQELKKQHKQIAQGNPTINIVRACRIDDGILSLNQQEVTDFKQLFEKKQSSISSCFFVPASGSGSRMFHFLHDFLNGSHNQESQEKTQHFINRIEEFPFSKKLPEKLREEIKSGEFNFEELIHYLLDEKGLKFAATPKGLVPFHKYGDFMITPIQEHLIQGKNIGGKNTTFHFTINNQFLKNFCFNVDIVEALTGMKYDVSYSVQDPLTNSIAFDSDLTPLKEENNYVTRPAGHGALLKNMNAIESDLIFIRNIDNIQHADKAEVSNNTRKALAGLLLKFKKEADEIIHCIDKKEPFEKHLDVLNKTYNLKLDANMLKDTAFIRTFLNRPKRVCGMVQNEGQPGGGPFWVKRADGVEQPQIIEKAQISNQPEQLKLVIRSTHFNPNEIVCSVMDHNENKFNLEHFANPDQYFVVKKTRMGKPITFIERPGLWNGGMYDWLTIFCEIDKHCFSPVKTVLDLLLPAHQGNKQR